MAIEIVERGEVLADRDYEVRCLGCKSWLKFKHSDAHKVEGEVQRAMRPMLGIECPVCKREVAVTE